MVVGTKDVSGARSPKFNSDMARREIVSLVSSTTLGREGSFADTQGGGSSLRYADKMKTLCLLMSSVAYTDVCVCVSELSEARLKQRKSQKVNGRGC